VSHPQPVLTAVRDHEEEWQPHAAEEFQQVGTVGKIAIGLLGASTVTHLLSTWSDWNTYSVVHRYLGGLPGVDDADLNRADAIAKVTAFPNVIVSVAAAVVFVIWLWRARINSEVFCQADHRRSHGWVLASWFVPGPNLWYPKQIVDDVWLASDPKTPVYADDLRRFRTPALTSVWWVAWVGALAFDVVVRRFLMWMEVTVGSLRGIALAGTASLVLTAVSAIAATMVIRKINSMQTGRKWIPWWDQSEPKLSAVPTYANDDTDEQPAISEPIAAGPALAPVRMERQPELQMAGGGAAPSPFAAGGFPGDGAAAGSFPGGGPFAGGAAPAAFGGDQPSDEPPKWSPFAPVVQGWQDEDDNNGPATQQFDPVQEWRQESSPAEQTAYVAPADKPSWNEYLNAGNEDLLSTSTSSSNWLDQTPPLTVVQPDPYSYQPQPESQPVQPQPVQPQPVQQQPVQQQPVQQQPVQQQPVQQQPVQQQPVQQQPWASNYSEPYSYDSTSDYLTSTSSAAEPAAPAPEPEPAPVARAGRRAARVAVDSPSAIQPAVSPSQPSSGYYEPAPAAAQEDDFLTPSKPLPPVPTYGPEPSYTSDNGYSSEPSYNSYDSSSYQTGSYPDYSSYDASNYSSNYESTDYGYSNSSEYTNSSYDSTSYDSYSGSQYNSSNESYESYSPNYATESYSTDYGNYYAQDEQQQPEYQQQAPYSYEQQPAQQQDEQTSTTPRTHPRRRWV
jgi:hypothetical protein